MVGRTGGTVLHLRGCLGLGCWSGLMAAALLSFIFVYPKSIQITSLYYLALFYLLLLLLVVVVLLLLLLLLFWPLTVYSFFSEILHSFIFHNPPCNPYSQSAV